MPKGKISILVGLLGGEKILIEMLCVVCKFMLDPNLSWQMVHPDLKEINTDTSFNLPVILDC